MKTRFAKLWYRLRARSVPLAVHGRAALLAPALRELYASGLNPYVFENLDRLLSRPHQVNRLLLLDPPQVAARLSQLLCYANQRSAHGGALQVLWLYDQSPPPPGTDRDTALVQIETRNLSQDAARTLLQRWPLHWGLDPLFDQPLHVLIAGDAPPAPALWAQLIGLGCYRDAPLMLTLLAADPKALCARINACYPYADNSAQLVFAPLTTLRLAPTAPITLALVCLDPPREALGFAAHLQRLLPQQHSYATPIVVKVSAEQRSDQNTDWDGQRIPFVYPDDSLHPQHLLRRRHDHLAQTIHAHYCDTIAAQGRDPQQESAGREWIALDESYRQANRQQADHVWAKLALTDCVAVPEEQIEHFRFTSAEIERLARVEHQRWATDRQLDGWKFAPVRDNALKHHPQLVPYDALSAAMKDLDRFAVRLVPTLLARTGLGISRMLIVGMIDDELARLHGRRALRFFGQALARLRARYPDRSLVLATSLSSSGARALVRLGLECYHCRLFWLCHQPLAMMLDEDAAPRREFLALLARAQRRINLPGLGEREAWLSQRAYAVIRGHNVTTNQQRRQREIGIDPQRGVTWNFDY